MWLSTWINSQKKAYYSATSTAAALPSQRETAFVMRCFEQHPDIIKGAFWPPYRTTRPISRHHLARPPLRNPAAQNGRRHRDTAVPLRRRPPVSYRFRRCGRSVRPRRTGWKQHRRPQKRPQGENYKFATKSPLTLFRKQKTKRDETNPDSTLPAASARPKASDGADRPHVLPAGPLSDSNAEDFEIREAFVTFARLSLTFLTFFIQYIQRK